MKAARNLSSQILGVTSQPSGKCLTEFPGQVVTLSFVAENP
jgi:hypothetical protein